MDDLVRSITTALVALACIFNSLSIIKVARRTSLLEGSSTPRPRTLLEYLAYRKGSAK